MALHPAFPISPYEELVEQADTSLQRFQYYFAQREAAESVIWLPGCEL